MTATVRWEEPPAPKLQGREARVYGPILDQLAERPGEWAHVGTAATMKYGWARAQSLRNAGGRRGLHVQTAVRQVEKHARLYARIVQ